MDNNEINNPSHGFDRLFTNMPPPTQAWGDMRSRLDDEMPVTNGLPIPGAIIKVNNGLLYSITWLFSALLLLTLLQLRFGPSGNDKRYTANSTIDNKTNNNIDTSSANGNKTAIESAKTQGLSTPQPIFNTQNTPVNIAGNNGTKLTAGKSNKRVSAQGNNKLKQAPAITGASINTTQNKITEQLQNARIDNTLATKQAQPVLANNDSVPSKQANKIQPANTATEAAPAAPVDSTKEWQAGLFFKTQLPFNGTQHYFAGSNGQSQPWRILLPGVWISYQYNRHLFDAEMNPFASLVYNPKPFNTVNVLVNGQTLVTKTEKLNKTFGTSLSVGYSYNVKNHWWAGGRIQSTIVTGGVATNEYNPANLLNGKTFGPLTGEDKDKLARLQVKLDAGLMYKTPCWTAGLRAGFYFSPSAIKNENINNPLETELFLRWRLWQHKK